MHVQAADLFPFLPWIREYGKAYLRADITAGLTVAVMAIPQSMAYALIAGLPVQYGLYASIVPAMIGALWGSSSHLITGPTTATSLVVLSTLIPLAEPYTLTYVKLAFLLAFMAGGVRIIMGLARLGALLNFVAHSVILGFTAGAAFLIAFHQVPHLLGLEVRKSSIVLESLWEILTHLHRTDVITLALGVATVAIILVIRKFRPGWPAALIALVIVGATVAVLHLENYGVRVVGAIPRSLPPFVLPRVSAWNDFAMLAPGALAIAILGLLEAMSSARAVAGYTRQRLNVNQEFIGQGLANISASVFSGYPVSGSFTRSALNLRSGAKTPVSGVVSGIGVAVLVLVAAPFAAVLPISALAGVLVLAASELVDMSGIKRAMRSTRSDGAVLVVTLVSTIFLQLAFAIYIGVLLSIGLHLAKTARPRIYSNVPDLATSKMVASVHGEICCQMDIVRIQGSIFFGSATYAQEDLLRRLKSHPGMANLLLRMHDVNILDASGVHALEMVLHEVRKRGGSLYFSALNSRVFQVFKNSGLLRQVGESHVRTTTRGAIRQAMVETFCPAVCALCEYTIFVECPELKKGNWEIFGEGVKPRSCAISRGKNSERQVSDS
jgi:SulP family sulfate permease